MVLILQPSPALKVDVDELVIRDAIDSNLSDYLKIMVTDASGVVRYQAKAGDHRFEDPDDAGLTDVFRITCDVADGSVKQSTSQITDGSIWEIEATGTITGAVATVDLVYLDLDLDALVFNDAATSALDIQGHRIDFDGATLTAMSLSSLYGLNLIMPSIIGVPIAAFAALTASDNINNVYIANGSLGISSTGISEEKYYKCEDFDEEAAAVTLDAGLRADEWTFGGNVGAAADVTYIAGAGGVLQVSSTATNDQSTGGYWIGTNILVNSNPILEFRFRVDSITAAKMGCLLGLTETVNILSINNIVGVSNDIIAVGMNSDLGNPENVRLWTNDNAGGEVVADLGVALTANVWCTVRIDCTDTEQPRIFINNTGGAITPAHEIVAATVGVGTIQAGIAMFPFLFIHCLDATPAEHHMEVDYVKYWQDRS